MHACLLAYDLQHNLGNRAIALIQKVSNIASNLTSKKFSQTNSRKFF